MRTINVTLRQRTKESPLTCQGNFPNVFDKAKLTIAAYPDEWFALNLLSSEEIGKIIRRRFIVPALAYVTTHSYVTSERGVHKGRAEFMHKTMIMIAYTYCLVGYWLSKPQGDWPKTFREVFKEFEDKPWGKRRKIRPYQLTAYIMEKEYKKERRKQGLNPWTKDMDSFRRTYITNNKVTIRWFKASINELEHGWLYDLPITSEDPEKEISNMLDNTFKDKDGQVFMVLPHKISSND